MRKALVVWGGWDGHEPALVAERVRKTLVGEGFDVEVCDSLDAFVGDEKLKALHLIVPIFTMSEISNEQCGAVMRAVESGVGLAGCHGGMCDAFRQNVDWQFMTGSQWVSHPGGDGTPYMVNVARSSSSPIVEGIADFQVSSEQYYLHVDPANNVLATTRFPVADGPHSTNGMVDVPVIYTKMWGKGRVFYTSLGHHDDVFDVPEAMETMRRGLLWCSDGKDAAAEK